MLKVAVTVLAASIVRAQVLVPEHPPPDQPAKVESAAAVAVKVTEVPELYVSVQSVPQLMPAGEEVTVPDPWPDLKTDKV